MNAQIPNCNNQLSSNSSLDKNMVLDLENTVPIARKLFMDTINNKQSLVHKLLTIIVAKEEYDNTWDTLTYPHIIGKNDFLIYPLGAAYLYDYSAPCSINKVKKSSFSFIQAEYSFSISLPFFRHYSGGYFYNTLNFILVIHVSLCADSNKITPATAKQYGWYNKFYHVEGGRKHISIQKIELLKIDTGVKSF